MKYRYITYIIVLLTLFTACSTENDVTSNVDIPTFPSDENWKEEVMDGASVTVKGFEPGDVTSRTSLVYNGQSLVFGWKLNEQILLYPTAYDLANAPEASTEGLLPQEDYPHPSFEQEPNLWRVDPNGANPSTFFVSQETTSQTTKIENGESDFFWDDIVRWSAYCQKGETRISSKEPSTYEKRYFRFAGQRQKALAEIGEYFDYEEAETKEDKDAHLNKYHLSEAAASEHLGLYDILISPETQWVDGVRINFQMRHIGAIARIYLKAVEENLVIKDVKLICETPIFHEEGSFTLFSHPYDDTKSSDNYGVDLDRASSGCQIKSEDDAKKMIQLDFDETCVTKKSGSGNRGPYVVAYLMMYPITYNPTTDGYLYAYVTAYKKGDDPSKEIHYVSEPLSKKTMKSGKYYQWSSEAHPDDGLFPIEMTATLKSWQEIVGADIDLDLEK